MQPKVCLVLNNLGLFNRAWTQILRNLGIDYTLCTTTGLTANANIQTPQGVFSPSSPDLRNYFRQFDAVILCDNRSEITSPSLINYSVFWLSWNAPEDPAFLFFNPHFSTAITESAYNSNFPSDFPIVRPSPSDIAGTLYPADGGSAGSTNPLSAAGTSGRGACVLFPAENIRAYVMTVCNTNSNTPYYWRLDTAKHSTLANTNYTHRVARNGKRWGNPRCPCAADQQRRYRDLPCGLRRGVPLPQQLLAACRAPPASRHRDMTTTRTCSGCSTACNSQACARAIGSLCRSRPTTRCKRLAQARRSITRLRRRWAFLKRQWDWMRDFARQRNTAIVNGLAWAQSTA
jgi:hypothetical protein